MLFGSMAVMLVAASSAYNLGQSCLVSRLECSGRHFLQDLGRGYYPRYISAVDCASRNCLSDACTTTSYKIKVLKRRGVEDLHPDGGLPEELRESWKLDHVEIPVACICSFYGLQPN